MAYKDKTGEFIFSPGERAGSLVVGIAGTLIGGVLLALAVEAADGVFGDDIFTMFDEHELLGEPSSLRDKLEVASIPGILGLILTPLSLMALKTTYSRYK